MAKILNILHLSDIHYRKKDAYNIAVVMKALAESLQHLAESSDRPSLVVMSGDLVNAADEDDVYYHFYDKVFDLVSAATRLSASRFVFLPGNHDVQQSSVHRSIDVMTGLQSRLTNRDQLNDAYASGALDSLAAANFSKYQEFLQFFESNSLVTRRPLFDVHFYPDIDVGVVALNTGALSWGGYDKRNDLRTLMFPEMAISEAMAACPKAGTWILGTHHPLNWLSEFCEQDFEATVRGHFGYHLFGHMHHPEPLFQTSVRGPRLDIQAGALYSGRSRYIGYSVLKLDTESGNSAVKLVSYSEARRQFHNAEQLVEGGVFYPTASAKSFWWRQSRTIDRPALMEWVAKTLLSQAEVDLNEGFSERRVCDVFVAPPLVSVGEFAPSDPDKEGLPERLEAPMAFEQLLQSNVNAIVYGPPEFGKTTLLRQIALQLMRTQPNRTGLTIPVVINFSDIVRGRDPIERQIRSSLRCDLPGITLHQALSEGIVTILVDDVAFEDQVRYDILKRFVTQWQSNRFIFATKIPEASRFNAKVDPDLPVTFEAVFIRRMNRGTMRSLVAKWDSGGKFDREAMLDRVVNEIIRINVPLTAVNGTILLIIYETQANFRAINRAVLVDTFVETLLDKGSPSSIQRRAFDFTNQKHLLSHIAGWMARNETYVVERKHLRTIVQTYLDNLGLSNDAEDLLQTFARTKILDVRTDGCIVFRYRAFLEYFIASEMQLHESFKAWVLEPDRYLSYSNEIQYYAGINRSDVALIDLVGARFLPIEQAIVSTLGFSPNPGTLDDFKLPDDKTFSDQMLAQYEQQMGAPPLSREDRDAVLEGELPSDDQPRQEVFRPRAKDSGQKLLLSLLLYSGLVRDLELIPDSSKRAHLAKIFDAWGLFLVVSLQIVPFIARHRRIIVNGVVYEVTAPRHFKEPEIARAIYTCMPSSLTALMLTSLGTEKLEKQLTEPHLGDQDEPKIVGFFRVSLMADLKLGNWWNLMEKFVAKNRTSEYLLNVMLWKMPELHVMGEVPEGGIKAFRSSMASTIALIRGDGHSKRSEITSKQIQRLTKEDMMRRLRVRRSDSGPS